MTKMYKMSYKVKGKQYNKIVSQSKAITLTKLYGKQKGFRAMKAPALKPGLGIGSGFGKIKIPPEKKSKRLPTRKELKKRDDRYSTQPVGEPIKYKEPTFRINTVTKTPKELYKKKFDKVELQKKLYKKTPELKKHPRWKGEERIQKSSLARNLRLEKIAIKLIDREFKAREWQLKFIEKVWEATPVKNIISRKAVEKRITKMKSDIEMNREVRGQIGRKGSPALLSWLERLIPTISKRLPFLETYKSKYLKRFGK